MSGKKRKSSHGITLISLLCLTVLLIAGYLLYSDQKHKKEIQDAADKKEAEEAMLQVNNEEVNQYASINIQTSDTDQTISLIQEDNQWYLKEDKEFPLDKDKVNQMVDHLTKLSVSKTVVESAEDLNEYGLDKPGTVITVKKLDGSERKLNIGDQLGINSDYYVSLDDNKNVYELPNSTGQYFMVKKEDLFYKPQNLSLTEPQIKELQLSTKTKGNFHIVYDENNPYDFTGLNKFKWYSTAENRNPVNVDDLSVSNMISDYLSFAVEKGIDYGDTAMESYGLKDPQAMIDLKYCDADDSSSEHEMVLHIGSQDEYGNYYVSFDDNDAVYLMQESQLSDKLAWKESDIVDPCVSLVNISYVSNFKIETDKIKDSYDIESGDDTQKSASENMTFKKNGEKVEDASSVRKLYTKLISISRHEFLPVNTTVTGSPVFKLNFTFTSGKELDVCYYDYDDSNYAVTLNGTVQSSVDKKQVDELIQSL